MRQRVMIAMALACDPKLLIADEPTTALDVTIQAQILDLLQRAAGARSGMAILLITHDLGVVAEMADRVVVMYCGRIVETAEIEDLFDRPASLHGRPAELDPQPLDRAGHGSTRSRARRPPRRTRTGLCLLSSRARSG